MQVDDTKPKSRKYIVRQQIVSDKDISPESREMLRRLCRSFDRKTESWIVHAIKRVRKRISGGC